MTLPSRIYLIGMMGVGKSTIGKKMAALLGFSFVDLDKEIEAREQKPISTIFSERGEAYFRQAESETLRAIRGNDIVIATGGGTPCHDNNMIYINSRGISIYLKANVGLLMQRISRNQARRPLLTGMNDEEMRRFIHEKLEEREPVYMQASHVFSIPSSSAETIVKSILSNDHA